MSVTIAVPQQDGDIHLAINGDGSNSYPVTKGKVSVDEAQVGAFLLLVPGAVVADKPVSAPSASTKG